MLGSRGVGESRFSNENVKSVVSQYQNISKMNLSVSENVGGIEKLYA